MNTLENSNIRSPSGKDEICAKFIINDLTVPFVFHDIVQNGKQYTMSFYAKAETDGNLTVGNTVMSISTKWSRYIAIFTADSENVSINFNTVGTYYLYNSQLELGNKATDFTLSPDDYSTTEQMNAAIELSKSAILLSVSETYALNTDITSLEARVESAELKLTKDGITSIVGSYYATLDDIEVGGRNLILKSDFSETSGNGTSIVVDSSQRMVTFTSDSLGNDLYFYLSLSDYAIDNLRNSTITVSGEYKINSALTYGTTNPWAGYQLFIGFDSESGLGSDFPDWLGGTSLPTEVTDGWVKWTRTYTIKDGDIVSHSCKVMFRDIIGSVSYRNLKIELGNISTDWTPAPEDTDVKITSVETIATQTSTMFNWLVQGNAGDITSLTLTDKMTELITDKLVIRGSDGTRTIISGGVMDIDTIFAQDITATGTITGANLIGATGSFSGSITSETGYIAGWNILTQCLYSDAVLSTDSDVTVTAILQNLNPTIISASDISVSNSGTYTVDGNDIYVTPASDGTTRLTVIIPLSGDGKYALSVNYSDYYNDGARTGSLSEYYQYWFGQYDSYGDRIWNTGFIIQDNGTYVTNFDGSTNYDFEIEGSVYDTKSTEDCPWGFVRLVFKMDAAVTGETYKFNFHLIKNGLPSDGSSPVYGTPLDAVLAIKRSTADVFTFPFYLLRDGTIYSNASATFDGILTTSNIIATGGTLAGFVINEDGLSSNYYGIKVNIKSLPIVSSYAVSTVDDVIIGEEETAPLAPDILTYLNTSVFYIEYQNESVFSVKPSGKVYAKYLRANMFECSNIIPYWSGTESADPVTVEGSRVGSEIYWFESIHAADFYESGVKLSEKYLALTGGTITGTLTAESMYANDFYESGIKLSEKYLALTGGTITGTLTAESMYSTEFYESGVKLSEKYLALTGGELTGLLSITSNGNTVQIGSINENWCHFINSANIPFYFDKAVHAVDGFTVYNSSTRLTAGALNIGLTGYHNGYIELYGTSPFIDFHHGNSTADYTSRIMSSASGTLTITGKLTVADTVEATNGFKGMLMEKGNNTISSTANDTTANWAKQCLSMHFYSTAGLLNNQPSTYGFLLNLGRGSEAHQLWFTQASGNMAHRSGNASGWAATWSVLLDSNNYKSYTHNFLTDSDGNNYAVFMTSNNNVVPGKRNGTTHVTNAGKTSLGSTVNYWASLFYSGSLSKQSDRRSKNPLGQVSMDEALTLMRGLSIEKFTYLNDDNQTVNYGVYAQDFRDLLIESGIGHVAALTIGVTETDRDTTDIFYDEDLVRYSIDYTQFVPLTIKGWQYHDIKLQNLDARQETMQLQIDQLQDENSKLRKEIDILKQQLLTA